MGVIKMAKKMGRARKMRRTRKTRKMRRMRKMRKISGRGHEPRAAGRSMWAFTIEFKF